MARKQTIAQAIEESIQHIADIRGEAALETAPQRKRRLVFMSFAGNANIKYGESYRRFKRRYEAGRPYRTHGDHVAQRPSYSTL